VSFTTVTFLTFLAIVWPLYWLLRARTPQNLLLILASYGFYAWWDWRFCSLMLISSLVDYLAGLGLGAARRAGVRRLLLLASLATNLGLLGFFKYFNFFVDSAASMMQAMGMTPSIHTLQIVLPVGISFYTFQTLSYTIDVYLGRIRPTRSAIDFFAYVAFFPQLVAGPIERASHLLPQFHEPRHFDAAFARDGLRLILWGFVKKLVLADNLAKLVDPAYADPGAASGPALLVATVAFAFQIYCDFSAYSDIAIGTARLFGIKLMRNFAYPYFSRDLAEFWRRWHISLSTWFRDYVFIPLGGSRHGTTRTAAAILTTFIISGLWHGASWNFILWGAIHGLGVLPLLLRRHDHKRRATDTAGGERNLPTLATVLQMTTTFALVCAAWVFFRASTFDAAVTVYRRTFTAMGEGWGDTLRLLFEQDQHLATTLHLMAFVVVEWLFRRHEHPLHAMHASRPVRWAIYTLLIYDVLMFGTQEQGAFLYFQF
jgi:alginate O-acetyltransferase complex protein AlgI